MFSLIEKPPPAGIGNSNRLPNIIFPHNMPKYMYEKKLNRLCKNFVIGI